MRVNRQQIMQIAALVGVVLLGFVVMSARAKKRTSKTGQLHITVLPLADSVQYIQGLEIQNVIERSFGFSLEGIPLSSLEMERLEAVLNEEPFVLNADAWLDANNDIHVKVEQRVPVIRVFDESGMEYYLDEGGVKMPLSSHHSARIVVATGAIPAFSPDYLEREDHPLKLVYDLASHLVDDAFWHPMIEQIHRNNDGSFVLIPKAGKQKVLLGSASGFDIKLRNLKSFYEQAMPLEGWKRYKEIDLRFDNQVICRR